MRKILSIIVISAFCITGIYSQMLVADPEMAYLKKKIPHLLNKKNVNNNTLETIDVLSKKTDIPTFGINNQLPLLNIRNMDGDLWLIDTMTVSLSGEVNGEIISGHHMYVYTYDQYGKGTQQRQMRLINSEMMPPVDKSSVEWEETQMINYYWNKYKPQQQDSMILYYRSSDGQNWDLQFRYFFKYDNNGNEIEYTCLIGEKATWGYSNRTIRTYDNSNNILSSIKKYLDENNIWKVTERSYYAYDKNNNLIKEDYFEGESETIAFEGRAYTYDENNNLLTDSSYSSSSYHEKDVFTYDNDGNMLTATTITTENISKGWDTIRHQVQSYDENGLPEEYFYYLWDEDVRKLAVTNHHTFEHDENNMLIKIYEHETDYLYRSLFERKCDEYYNMTEERSYVWDSDKEDWMDYFYTARTYDEHKNCIEAKSMILTKDNSWTPYNDVLFWTYNGGKSMSSFGEVWRAELTYTKSGEETSNEKIEDISESIKIYPNPVSDVMNVSCTLTTSEPMKVKIFDLSGKLISQTVISEHSGGTVKSINMSGLSRGLYLLNITIGKQTFSKKFIKK